MTSVRPTSLSTAWSRAESATEGSTPNPPSIATRQTVVETVTTPIRP